MTRIVGPRSARAIKIRDRNVTRMIKTLMAVQLPETESVTVTLSRDGSLSMTPQPEMSPQDLADQHSLLNSNDDRAKLIKSLMAQLSSHGSLSDSGSVHLELEHIPAVR